MDKYYTNVKSPTLVATYDASISSSTAITLNVATKYIVVTALLKGIFLKWGATASSSAFDEFIAPESTVLFVIPTGATTANFIEEAATAHLVVLEK
jgi:hypothetical protein